MKSSPPSSRPAKIPTSSLSTAPSSRPSVFFGKLELLSLPAFQFALNTDYSSAIGCTPFEAGHGLNATTISQARIMVTKASILAEGGRDGDILEDVDEFLDKSLVKDLFELVMRMAEITRSTSE